MLTVLTSDLHPNSERNIKHYRDNLSIRLESIFLVLHVLEGIPNFIGRLTEH